MTLNFGSNTISVLPGTATGLGPATTYPAGAGPISVALLDQNKDGNLDIAETDYISGVLMIRAQGHVEVPPDTSIFADGNWHEAPPLGRIAYHAGAYDPVRKLFWIFGGKRGNGGPTNDIWVFDFGLGGMTSREVATAGIRPLPRQGHFVFLDAVRDRLIVFGGSGHINEVWTLNLSGTPTWQQVLPTGTPPTLRDGTTTVFDSARNRLLVFGGKDATPTYFNEVWAVSLDSSPAWSQILPSGSLPLPRWGATGVYDPVGDRLIIAGGRSSAALSDTWALSLTSPT